MTVYIDVFFLINFIADFFILCIVSPKATIKKFKICIASIIGALYSCLYFFNIDFFSISYKLLVLFIMVFTAFYPIKFKKLIVTFIQAYISSAFLCGITLSLISLYGNTNSLNIYNTSDLFLIIAMSSGYVLIKYANNIFKKNIAKKNHEIEIYYNGKKVKINGVIDSCNNLCDPITKKPVIVVNGVILKALLSDSLEENNLCEFVKPEDFCIIPYKTISNSGILYGFKPEKIIIENKLITDIIIAHSPAKICEDALINPLIV